MERRKNKDVASDYAKAVLLNDLLEAYEDGIPTCPICGSEIVASEGRKEPFFWTCTQKGCYSRSVDQPPLTGDMIVCSNCGDPVEFGEWGRKPAWRCTSNYRHHQPVVRTHLLLPKMCALIPPRELIRLKKNFEKKSNTISCNDLQLSLDFDED